jgi:VanZ family protein
MLRLSRRLSFWRCAFASALLATGVLSLLPATETLPSTGWDKSNHLIGYALLAALARLGWPRTRAWWQFIGLTAWGALIEVVQGATGYRHAEWGDVFANGLGALLGAALLESARRLLRQAERPR